MEQNLQQLTLGGKSEGDLTYGREMWAQCEALTAGESSNQFHMVG